VILESAALSSPRLTRPDSSSAEQKSWLVPGMDPFVDGFNVSQLISHWASVQPDTIALARPSGRSTDGHTRFTTFTFAKLDERCSRAAHVLSREGLRPGDRVGLFVTDGVDFVTFVYALQRMGAVPVLIDPGMGAKNAVKCIEEQKLTGFVGVMKAHVLRLVFRRAFQTVTTAILTGPGRFPGAKKIARLVEDLPRELRHARFPAYPAKSDAPATIVYTSGSTGVPKGVVYTNGMMAAQVAGVARVGRFQPGETHVACFPGFALYAAGIGMRTVFPEMDFTKPKAARPAHVIDAIDAFDATTVFASPALWDTFSRAVVAEKIELPRVRALFSSGAAVQPALIERLLPAVPSGDLYTPYGATEALPIATVSGREVLTLHAEKTRDGKGTCVGRIADDTEVRIIAISDAPIVDLTNDLLLPAGEIGEIVVTGPQVTKVYDQRPDETLRSKMHDSRGRTWHRVGDVGYLDDKGLLWFCGRKGHRVVTKAGVLFSVPVEAVFETHPSVRRAALTWVGERPQQTPVVCIELDPSVNGSVALLDELRAIGKKHVVTKGIDHVLFHPHFPVDRRHNAKIEREKLAVWAAQRVK
jgi:acyl-CoA synthetase (AMP-forming)/AMP-acid ligase II